MVHLTPSRLAESHRTAMQFFTEYFVSRMKRIHHASFPYAEILDRASRVQTRHVSFSYDVVFLLSHNFFRYNYKKSTTTNTQPSQAPQRHTIVYNNYKFINSMMLKMSRSKRTTKKSAVGATTTTTSHQSRKKQAPAKKRSSTTKRTSVRTERRTSQVMIENIADSFGVSIDSVPPFRRSLSRKNKRNKMDREADQLLFALS